MDLEMGFKSNNVEKKTRLDMAFGQKIAVKYTHKVANSVASSPSMLLVRISRQLIFENMVYTIIQCFEDY